MISNDEIDFNAPILTEFSSGELLCHILSVLERQPVKGMHQNPRTTAASLQNIRKALEILKRKPTYPTRLFHIDE